MDHTGHEIYRRLVELSRDGFLIATIDGRIVYASPRLEELFGYVRDELKGKQVELLLPNTLRVAHIGHREKFSARPTERQMGEGRELKGQRFDGSSIDVEVGISAIAIEGVRHLVAVIRDVGPYRVPAAE